MNYDMKESGKRIQQLRIQHRYSQQQLAKELNVNRSYLSRIESGHNGCSVDLFVQLSNLFQVSLDDLILGQNQQNISSNKKQLEETINQLISQLEVFKDSL